jgi:hypothetical protein
MTLLEGERGEIMRDLSVGTPSDYWCNSGGLTHYYRFVAPRDSEYSFYIEESTFDGVLSVRDTCHALNESPRCNDDSYIQSNPYLLVSLDAHEEIYLTVGAYKSSGSGTYTLQYIPCLIEEGCPE